MDRDGQCAIGRGIDVLGELTDIDGVECAIAKGVGISQLSATTDENAPTDSANAVTNLFIFDAPLHADSPCRAYVDIMLTFCNRFAIYSKNYFRKQNQWENTNVCRTSLTSTQPVAIWVDQHSGQICLDNVRHGHTRCAKFQIRR